MRAPAGASPDCEWFCRASNIVWPAKLDEVCRGWDDAAPEASACQKIAEGRGPGVSAQGVVARLASTCDRCLERAYVGLLADVADPTSDRRCEAVPLDAPTDVTGHAAPPRLFRSRGGGPAAALRSCFDTPTPEDDYWPARAFQGVTRQEELNAARSRLSRGQGIAQERAPAEQASSSASASLLAQGPVQSSGAPAGATEQKSQGAFCSAGEDGLLTCWEATTAAKDAGDDQPRVIAVASELETSANAKAKATLRRGAGAARTTVADARASLLTTSLGPPFLD